MFPQYGKLWPTNGWDWFGSLVHPSKFQRVSYLGSVTAWHCSSGRQPNFAALNRGRQLYSPGRPPRWALARILVENIFRMPFTKKCYKSAHFDGIIPKKKRVHIFETVRVPSVLWHCWLGVRKSIRPAKNLSDEVLARLSLWIEVQMISICIQLMPLSPYVILLH